VAMTTITLTGKGVEEVQALDIRISVEAIVNISAEMARRKVTGWLVDEVGNMLIGGKPQLVISQQTVWRVPAILTSFNIGTVGEVGTIDVDAVTGKLIVSHKLKQRILDNVH